MRIAALSVCLILCSVVLFADDHNVDFDSHTDFSILKTFTLNDGKVSSRKPELNNSLIVKKVGDAIRSELIGKGLKETTDRPDVVLDFSITGVDFVGGRGGRGGPPIGSEATLVIDLTTRDLKTLVWRGVYRDDEKNTAKLAQKLPGDVKKVLSEYPPRQNHVIENASAVTFTETRLELTPKAAAAAALDIVQSIRRDTDYVGPAAHPGLSISLGALERAAQAVSDDRARNPEATTAANNSFFNALKSSAGFAESIATRPNETPDSKEESGELAAKLRALVPPDSSNR